MKKFLAALSAALMVGVLSFAQPALAAEPSVHEIYQAADAGRMNDANRMIKEVLEAHPESGKAHYVNAELLAKQNRTHEAAAELAKAEKLAPGLPFANAQAVTSLRSLIEKPAARTSSSSSGSARADQTTYTQSAAGNSGGGFPWGVVIAGVGVVLFIAWAVRFMTRRNAAPSYKDGYNGGPSGGGYGYPQGGPAAPYGGTPYGGAPAYGPAPQAPGLGSQVLGGLATGAAVGVGVAAGEELFRHVFDGNHNNASNNNQHLSNNDSGYTPFQSIPDQNVSDNNRYDNMGGNDFGINDTSSWDDGGGASGGNDDWT